MGGDFGSSGHQSLGPDTVSIIYARLAERFHNADKQDRRLLIPRKVLPIEGVAGLLFPLREKYREIETMSMNHTHQLLRNVFLEDHATSSDNLGNRSVTCLYLFDLPPKNWPT